jgi:hypothetical protein
LYAGHAIEEPQEAAYANSSRRRRSKKCVSSTEITRGDASDRSGRTSWTEGLYGAVGVSKNRCHRSGATGSDRKDGLSGTKDSASRGALADTRT